MIPTQTMQRKMEQEDGSELKVEDPVRVLVTLEVEGVLRSWNDEWLEITDTAGARRDFHLSALSRVLRRKP